MRVGSLLCAVLLSGCSGIIEPPSGSGGEDGAPGGPTAGPEGPAGPDGREPVPSTTVRRLSAHELARTIEVLTGITPEALSLLPPESSELPFDRVVNAQTVSPAHLDAHLAIASEVAATLLAERRLDDLTDACPDEVLPPATTPTVTRVSGAGLGGGPEWAFSVDASDPTRTRVRYAPDPTVSYTHSFTAPGLYTLVLRVDVVQGPVDVTEVWVGGERVDAIPSTDGPTEYTSTVEVDAAAPLVIEYRFLTEPDDNNLTIVFDELTISGPEDEGAVTYADERRACIEGVIDDFTPLAFRRPITADERARLLALFETGEAGSGWAAGLSMVMQAILASPSFLYLVEIGTPVEGSPGWFRLGPWETAARLSYSLCEGPPDAELREAAAAGELETAAHRETHARRLLDEPCGRRAVRRFVEQWLRLDDLPSLNKSPEEFPELTDEVRSALVTDTARYIDEMLWTERADLRTLYTDPVAWPSDASAFLYGLVGGAGERTALPPERAGILTQPGFLAVTAPFAETSPVERGVFVVEQILCEELSPPPPELEVAPPIPDPGLTTRERWAEHSSNPGCSSCHSMIDPVGFAFEEFDAIGRHRTEENGRPIDASGGVPTLGIEDGELWGAAELSEAIAGSPVAADCFARQWLRFAMGRLELEADEDGLAATAEVLEAEPITEALVAVVRSESFAHRFETEEGSE